MHPKSRFCPEVMLCAEKGRVRSLVKAVEEFGSRIANSAGLWQGVSTIALPL